VKNAGNERRVQLPTHLRWISLDQLRIAPEGEGQRELKQYRVDRMLARGFNPDIMGYPEVSERDGHFWVIDGQCRVEALKVWLGEWHGQEIQCRVHTGLTMEQEAELFLMLNDFIAVSSMASFKNAVKAGRADEVDVDRVVRSNGLVISKDKGENSIGAVGTLTRIYQRGGAVVLGRALRIARDAYGTPGLEGPVLDGLARLCQRYNGELDEKAAIDKLSKRFGGVNGLMGDANKIRKSTGSQLADCVAAAAVETYNAGRGGKKLTPWWKS